METRRMMIVPQAELDLIQNPRFHRRMMRLPALENRCPLQEGHPYRLKAKGKGQTIVITVVEVRREPLDWIATRDAKREGYASTRGAIEAFIRVHGEHEEVWVIGFVRGDESAFYRQADPIYLRRGGGYTTLWDELDAGEVTIAPGAAERARIAALVARQAPARAALKRMSDEAQTLKQSMTSMKARNRLKLIEREVERMTAELPVCEVIRSEHSGQSESDPASPATAVITGSRHASVAAELSADAA